MRAASQVLMDLARRLSQKTLPDMISEPKTNKQKLRNGLLSFLEERKCRWRSSEVSSAGINLLNALTDTLWTIDGHHNVLNSQGYRIPDIFCTFVGFNRPELLKHRKRQIGNLSGSVLRSLSCHLFHCLQDGYWHRCEWVLMRVEIEALAKSIARYADYLEETNKRVKFNHKLSSPVRELSENINFQFLPMASSTISALSELQHRLEQVELFEFVSVEEICPTSI